MIGTLMKVDFQRAVLCRIPKMEVSDAPSFRQVMFLCDEYHSFVTAGETDPTGMRNSSALSRQAARIPHRGHAEHQFPSVCGTWGVLENPVADLSDEDLLTLSDDFSSRVASDLCGRDEQLKLSYNFSESGQDAQVSLLSGRTTAHKASVCLKELLGSKRQRL